jgi:ADP-ribose pyrophosphatase YjhB (NUDIX family)
MIMLQWLPQATQAELNELAQRYGQPLVEIVDLGTSNRFDPLNNRDRYGEVCMVVRRKNGRLLTMKKTFYPHDAYRLLTGGINHGEKVFDALLRETQEETALEVSVERFLAAAAYKTTTTGEVPAFYTFAFLLNELSGTLQVLDEHEKVEGFREILPEELLERAEFLETINTTYSNSIDGDWKDWGHFRAVMHRLVWQALSRQTGVKILP